MIVNIVSPSGDTVRLVNRNWNRHYLNIWFDTDEPEDGPGELEDYNGYDARGLWVIQACQYTSHIDFIFDSWAIQVYGEESGLGDDGQKPLKFGIISNYPNPFNSLVKIQFGLSGPGLTTLAIYDILGRKVATLLDRYLPSMVHSVTWNAGNLPSGVYFYRLKSSGKTAYGQVTLLK